MVEEGGEAPDFTVPMAGGSAYNDIEEFTLSEVVGDGPIVLAFYPAAFTSGCTQEMCAFRDSMDGFGDLDAQVFGVSVDLVFAQNIWMQEENLNFPMLSDWKHEVIRKYEVILEDMYGMIETAERSIFVVDTEGVVSYKWIRGEERADYEELVARTQDAVADVAGT